MPGVKYQVPADHAILAVHPHQFRVSSDNAMLDSGSGFLVECWDRTNRKPVTFSVHTGRDFHGPDDTWDTKPDANATDEDRAENTAYLAAHDFVKNVLAAAETAHRIEQGRTVEVHKGRKCPKGRYEVTAHRQGNYGPYVNLRTPDGKYHNYISVENVRVVPDYATAFRTKDTAAILGLLVKTAEEGFSPTAWGVLADYIEEFEVAVLEGRGVPPAAFADALRRVTAAPDAPKLSTYYADCHNEFRHLFAGV
jgi:hypothetical protein